MFGIPFNALGGLFGMGHRGSRGPSGMVKLAQQFYDRNQAGTGQQGGGAGMVGGAMGQFTPEQSGVANYSGGDLAAQFAPTPSGMPTEDANFGGKMPIQDSTTIDGSIGGGAGGWPGAAKGGAVRGGAGMMLPWGRMGGGGMMKNQLMALLGRRMG